jgi:recombinational DNA repair protein (RecF pathway)
MVLQVLLQGSGKKSFFLRSGKKNRKKFPTMPEVFEMGSFEYAAEARDLLNLSSYIPKRSHPHIREDLDAFICSSLALESLSLLSFEDSSHEAALLLQLADDFLTQIEVAKEAKEKLNLVYQFLVELLAHSGVIDPELFESASKNRLKMLLRIVEETGEKGLRSLKEFEGFYGRVLG